MDLILNRFKKDFEYKEITEGSYDNNGDYIPGVEITIPFKGAMLPISEKDMQYLPDGFYGISDQKLYTSEVLKDNTKIKDTVTEEEYTIYAFKSYNIIDENFKRYFMKEVVKVNG